MAEAKNTLTFKAEVKKVASTTLASLDKQLTITLITDDTKTLALGALAPMTLVNVTVEVEEEDD